MNTEFNSLTNNSVDNSISRHDALSESDEIKKVIDEEIDGLNQQNGMGALMALSGWANDNVNTVIDSNKIVIKELTDLRMKVLELML